MSRIGDIDLSRVEHVTIAGVTLIHGDALQMLPRIAGLADLLVTDPPYMLTSGGHRGDSMRGIFARENYGNTGRLMEITNWEDMASPIFDACRENADGYVMANDKNVFRAHSAFTEAGWKFHNLLTWAKGHATRNRWYMKDTEQILYFWKGRAKTIRNPGSKQLMKVSAPRGSERIHPTEKPVNLLRILIENSSDAGDLVLDPFAGSASTLVAALQVGRRAIGFEMDKELWQAAAARLLAEEILHARAG